MLINTKDAILYKKLALSREARMTTLLNWYYIYNFHSFVAVLSESAIQCPYASLLYGVYRLIIQRKQQS
jgi:hypothetical protein